MIASLDFPEETPPGEKIASACWLGEPPPLPKPKPAAHKPAGLDARSQALLERRLDELEERCSFTGDEMDLIWQGVYPEGAPPQSPDAEVVVGARVRDRVRHVLKLARKAKDRAVPLADWLALTDELFWVRQSRTHVVVSPRAIEALSKMMQVCEVRRDLVLDFDRWIALLEKILPERYLEPAREAGRPCPHQPLTEERVRWYRKRHHFQRCLWHPQDAGNRDVLAPEADGQGRRIEAPDAPEAVGCETGCTDRAHPKKKRHAAKPRTVEEKVAAGEGPPPHYHQGMLRFEDALMPEEENYNPSRYVLADKGDVEGGEAARVCREVRA